MFDTNFLGYQPTGQTVSVFMFISQILSAIRADVNVILFKIVSPDQQLSAIGRRTDVNFEHCKKRILWNVLVPLIHDLAMPACSISKHNLENTSVFY